MCLDCGNKAKYTRTGQRSLCIFCFYKAFVCQYAFYLNLVCILSLEFDLLVDFPKTNSVCQTQFLAIYVYFLMGYGLLWNSFYAEKALMWNFLVSQKKPHIPDNYSEIEKKLKEAKWEKERLLEDMQREEALLDQSKLNYQVKKEEFVKFIAKTSPYAAAQVILYKPYSYNKILLDFYSYYICIYA